MRHFTNDEKLQIVKIFDAVGAPDFLRLMGSLVSDRHGRDDARATLFKLAREIQGSKRMTDPKPLIEVLD